MPTFAGWKTTLAGASARARLSEPEEFLEPHVRGARAAHAVRFELGLDTAPIADLWDVIEKRGVDLAFHDFGARGGDGVYLWNGERGLIVINAAKGKVPLRQRFTAAHELGHHEMHRRPNEELLAADKNVDDEESDLEREANAFAANLLAPDRSLRQELVGREPDTIDAIDVVRLMRLYGLSYVAMLNRLVHAGCLRVRDRERLQTVGKEQGAIPRLARAVGFDFEAAFPPGPPLPEEYVLKVIDLYRGAVISNRRTAELLRMPAKQAQTLARELAAAQVEINEADPGLDALLRA